MRTTLRPDARWTFAVILLAAVVTEWLRVPTGVAALAAILLGAAVVMLAGRGSGPLVWVMRGTVALLLGVIGWQTYRLDRITDDWPAQRERLVARASTYLGEELRASGAVLRSTAENAARSCGGSREAAFAELATARPLGRTELVVAIVQDGGAPWAWAGRHRGVPESGEDSLSVESNPTHLGLVLRKPCDHDRQVVASLLIWTSPSDPGHANSVVERFRRATDVALRVWPGDLAPDSPDVFDYQYETAQGTRTLFSLQVVPPDQGAHWTLVAGRGGVRVVVLLVLLLLVAFLLAPPGLARASLLPALAWVAARAPLAATFKSGAFWSEATFYREFLGPFSASAGALLVVGAVGTVLAAAFWEAHPRRRPIGVATAALLALGAPYLISSLARGITPPSDGVPLGLWLTWEFALVAAAAASVALAAALTRGEGEATRVPWSWWLGIATAVGAAWLGLIVWSPRGGWPDWYPLPWAAALALLLWRPAPRWATIVGLGLVAGSAAALATWGAELEGRLQVARRDVQRLGVELDPLTIPRATALAALADSAPPAGAADLYALWRAMPSAGDDYPALLSLWGADGREETELLLDSVDVPPPLLAALIRDLPPDEPARITTLNRVPGVHLVLLHRLPDARVLAVALGPRTQLIPPATLSRLLEAPPRGAPLYELALGTPDPGAEGDPGPFRWERNGWLVTGDRHLELPGGVRHVHARVDLGSPSRLLARGILVLVADATFLALLWAIGGSLLGASGPRPRWRRLVRSYRVRLAVTLATFFVVPALLFATWTFARTRDDAARRRDLLLAQTLRSAQPLAAAFSSGPEGDPRLEDLTRGTGAEFGLYRGGLLAGVSHPVLADLGVLPALLPGRAFTSLVLGDDLERMVDVTGAEGRILRMGYRVVRPGTPAEMRVLAAPRLSDDGGLGREQEDLALIVLLAALLGAAASIGAAQFAARALARPVSDLRAAALAVGRGEPPPLATSDPPVEFEPVFTGFTRMAADVEAGREALDEARRRTAAVLATVATGVVAVDPAGRVLLANGRARSWLGATLSEGTDFAAALPAGWEPVAAAVARALTGASVAPLEVEAGERRFGAELAGLGADPGGVVLALTDLTDAAHTARVLAWGEMARQIAHEIKNPLTPLRLGLQHLRRVREERPTEFDRTFDETSGRILSEIDRLDTVARAFSRYALPADAAEPLEILDLGAAIEEALVLYRLDAAGTPVRFERGAPVGVRARRDELKEVLVNLVENARNAGARAVTIRLVNTRLEVTDDGQGIAPADLPRIFEPRFSTTTSGTGLGLSIVKRLVESWGATISATSTPGQGATLSIEFVAGR
jgi:signal transduction histidine kinase